jgi:hypothetical protein
MTISQDWKECIWLVLELHKDGGAIHKRTPLQKMVVCEKAKRDAAKCMMLDTSQCAARAGRH